MRAAIVKSFGPINDVISVADNVPKPVRGTGKASDKHMIIKVLACSPSPGDRRAVSGSVSLIRSPKTWPYIPGHDVCGIVEEVPPGNINFRKGDCVISTSPAIFMKDGLAEYAPVAISHSAVKPQGVSATDACCVGTSLVRAMMASRINLKGRPNARVLVLGGSGGFGTFLLQCLKLDGAAFVATTSTQKELCESLGADRVIDYTTTNWWEVEEFKEDKFDVVFNCNPTPVVGKSSWNLARGSCLKSNGRFVAVTADDPNIQLHTVWDMLKLMPGLMFTPITNKLRPWSPDYVYFLGTGTSAVELGLALELIAQGKVKVIMDNNSPHAFNTEGVRAAFLAVDGKHAHGKVVVDLERT